MPVNYASALRVVGKNVCRAAAEEVYNVACHSLISHHCLNVALFVPLSLFFFSLALPVCNVHVALCMA